MSIIDEFNVSLELDGILFNGVVKSIDGSVRNSLADDKVTEGCFPSRLLSPITSTGYWCDEVLSALLNFELGTNSCLLYIDTGCSIVSFLKEAKTDFLST